MQLKFRCPECRVSGLTPDIREDKALAVALKQLRIRCPACSAIVEVTEPPGRVLLRTQKYVTAFVVERAEQLVREALKAKIASEQAKECKEQGQGQQDGAASGNQPISLETNSTSSAADSRR